MDLMNSSPNFGRDANDTLRLMVEQAPSMLAYWDRDLRCRFANRAYERWFGVDPSRLVGTSLKDLLGAQLFELNEPYIRAVLKGEEQVFERVVPGPDGVRRHSLATYVPDIVDGELMGFIAYVTEVTQLKEAEAALRAEASRLETAVAQLRDSEARLVEAQRLGGVGNWEWDIATDITFWSAELYRIFGRDPTGQPPTYAEHPNLYIKESWERLASCVATASRTGEPYTLELEYVRADGQTGWLEARGEAVRGKLGQISRLRGTVHEVTLRHQMEEARVKVRTAEAASRNKTRLMLHISHELRTPLNAILGFSYLFELDPTLDPTQRRRAAAIASGGRQMLELVEQVLDLTAADAGRIEVQRVDIEPLPILQECLQHASAAAAAGGITLRAIDPGSARVQALGDTNRLKQVISKLVSNGIKYTPAAGTVRVTLLELGSSVEIAV
jgi:PAS domain S-box-containing protein